MSWPRAHRRAFALLFPVVVPLWLLLVFASILSIPLLHLGSALMTFWNGRQRIYYRRSEYYSYRRFGERQSIADSEDRRAEVERKEITPAAS